MVIIVSEIINGIEYKEITVRGRTKLVSKYGDLINPRKRNQKATLHMNKDGYPCCGGGIPIHLYVAYGWVDGYFEGAVVNHKDSNIKNNRFDNLEWITQKENIHKSYISSGIDQTRNFQIYNFYYKNDFIGQFKGRPAVCKYIDEHNLDCSKTGIVRNNKSKGYRLEIV